MDEIMITENTLDSPLGVGKLQYNKCLCKHLKSTYQKSCSKTNIIWKPTTQVVFMTLTLLLVCGVPGIDCEHQNHNETTETKEVTDNEDDKRRSIDVGMDPLYFMTKGFLDLIQPVSKGFILEEADLVADVVNGDFQLVLLSMGDSDWQLWIEHYLGFVICAAIGIVFIVFMPLIGLCFCCCRCCGNCGGKGDQEEKRGDRCKRGVCGSILLIFLLIILSGMVCAFVTNELLREQTAQDEDHALLNRISLEITSLEKFRTNTIKDFKTKVIGSLHRTADNLLSEIQNAAGNAKNALGTITNSADMLTKAVALAGTAEQINHTLTAVKETTTVLLEDQANLEKNLSDIRGDMLNTLNGCSIQRCNDLNTKVQSLDTGVNFVQVDDISQELNDVQQVLGNNLASLINDGKSQYEDIASKVQNDIQSELNEAEKKVNNFTETVEGKVDKITSDLEKLNLNQTRSAITDNQPLIDEYGNYRYYGGMVLCCILLLVVLFGLLGLCFGICGESAGEDAPACNRGVGATILMFGVALCFLFSWILMTIVLVLFLGGGLLHTEVCRYVSDIPNAPQPIQNTINQLASQQLQQWNWDIKVVDVIKDCKENKAIFTSFHLDQFVNISDVLNIDNYNIDEKIENLITSVNVDLSNVIIFSNGTRKELVDLNAAGLVNIDFDSYQMQLSNPLTSQNLTRMINDLEAAATELESTDQGRANSLRLYADTLRTIQSTTVATMEAHRNQLASSLTPLKSAIVGPPNINEEIQQLIDTLSNAQNNIQQNGTILIRKFIEAYGQKILDQLDEDTQALGYQIENDIGRCEPAYRSFSNIIDASCDALLEPFNGFWFSIGMSLFFLIPLIITAIILVGLYRKTDEYYDDKSFDDVKMPLASSHRYMIGKKRKDYKDDEERNYDAYTGVYPGDNIPLEDINPCKMLRPSTCARSTGGTHGLYNAGYLTDDYPVALPSSNCTTRNRDAPPGYGDRTYGDDSYPLGGPYPAGDYTIPLSTNPISPPHYNDNSRPRMY